MAFNLGGGPSSGAPHELEANAEINITPFIDVILVLLIVFMVAAPLATSDIGVKLPSSGAPQKSRPAKPIFVTLTTDLKTAVGDDIVARDQIGPMLDKLTKGDKNQTIYLRIDEGVKYKEITKVMDILRSQQYLKVGLVGQTGTGG